MIFSFTYRTKTNTLIILNLYLQKSSLELILQIPGNSIIPSKHHQIRLILIFPDTDQKWYEL